MNWSGRGALISKCWTAPWFRSAIGSDPGGFATILCYFPSPDLEHFQNDPELYLGDEIYADVSAGI